MHVDLDGRTALVTGASRNIGRAIAETLAQAGADVGVTARTNREGCEETANRVEAAGQQTSVALGDLGDPDDIEDVVDAVRSDFGGIDILVNNATVRPSAPFLNVDIRDLNDVSDVNIRGIFLTTQHVVPDMIDTGGGSVVNLIGAMVYLGLPGRTHSFATKLGIEGLVRQLASELGADNIRVNGVSPGLIDTERARGASWERTERQLVNATPLDRMGTVDEVAEACCFLASDRASFITGQVLHVNGGIYPTANIVQPE